MNTVNHPEHYKKEGRKECLVEIEEKYGKHAIAFFCLGNSYKYLYRAGLKEGNSYEQDIAKARWYRDYLLNRGWFNSQDMVIGEKLENMWLDINDQLGDLEEKKPLFARIKGKLRRKKDE